MKKIYYARQVRDKFIVTKYNYFYENSYQYFIASDDYMFSIEKITANSSCFKTKKLANEYAKLKNKEMKNKIKEEFEHIDITHLFQ